MIEFYSVFIYLLSAHNTKRQKERDNELIYHGSEREEKKYRTNAPIVGIAIVTNAPISRSCNRSKEKRRNAPSQERQEGSYSMSAFDKKLEHLLTNYLGSTSAQHDIRQLNIYTENSKFKILSMKERKRNYFIWKKTNSNLIDVATDDDEIGNAKFQSNTVAVPTTTHEIMSTEEFISNEIQPENGSIEQVISGNSTEEGTNGVADDNDDTVATTTTTPIFTDIETN